MLHTGPLNSGPRILGCTYNVARARSPLHRSITTLATLTTKAFPWKFTVISMIVVIEMDGQTNRQTSQALNSLRHQLDIVPLHSDLDYQSQRIALDMGRSG